MASLSCHDDSDCYKTQIIRTFHLYIIQLWSPFSHIFTHADVVNAQNWEVSPQKNPVEPPQSPIKQYFSLLHTTVTELSEDISVAISVTPSVLRLFP